MPAGRPPKYKTAEELSDKICQYFQELKDKKETPTITGLVLYCGFCDRCSFYDMEKQDKFSYTIKKARTTMEMVYEQFLLSGNNVAGAIFALKNFGWKDKTELDVNANLSFSETLNKARERAKQN